MSSRRPEIEEIFVGEVQQTGRLCAPLHSLYSIRSISPLHQQPIQSVLEKIATKFHAENSMIIHASTLQNATISFSTHDSAIRALRATKHKNILYIDGSPYEFSINHSMNNLYQTLSDRIVRVTLDKLPLHLR